MIGVFASTAPMCDGCNRSHLPALKQEKRKGRNKGYIWNGPHVKQTREGANINCVCTNCKSIAAGTNMHGRWLKYWSAFLLAYVHVMHDSTPRQIKRCLSQLFEMKRKVPRIWSFSGEFSRCGLPAIGGMRLNL